MTVSLAKGRNKHDVSRAVLTLPKVGAAVAFIDVHAASDFAPGDAVTLTIDDVALQLRVEDCVRNEHGTLKITGISGSGKMHLLSKAKGLDEGPALKAVIKHLCEQSGDVLDEANSDGTVLSARLRQWQVTSTDTVARQLSNVLNKHKAVWRHSFDGKVLIVRDNAYDAFEPDSKTFFVQEATTFDSDIKFKVGKLVELPNGACEYEGKNFDEVILTVTPQTMELKLRGVALRELYANPIQRGSMQKVLAAASFPAVVQKQNSDGTLEVVPDDPAIKGEGVNNIRVRFGIPGVTVTNIERGTHVVVSYDNNDLGSPYISAFFREEAKSFLITIGSTADAQFVAMANICNENFTAIRDFINNTMVVSTPTGPSAPGATAGGTTLPELDDVSCERLKTV